MTSKIFSCSISGLECNIIEVEADVSNGLAHFSIVGLGDVSVQESKDRIRASIKNSNAEFPTTRKTVNLAPAQLKKQGSIFDLPIAISLLVASNQITDQRLVDSMVIGELSLDGKIKSIQGALPITQFAKERGFKKIFLPMGNAEEASFIEGIDIYPLEHLSEIIKYSQGALEIGRYKVLINRRLVKTEPKDYLSAIIGLDKAKRALSIAASGGHNLLLNGSPGCGKTLLARALQTLMPQMSKSEVLETTKILSITGELNKENPISYQRPFREVHNTASLVSVLGGGASKASPGEISLAHNGILFLDEISEFPRSILESLRQPLENGYINLSRANFSSRFPANFILIATTNPCPCGYKNDQKIKCICTLGQIRNYQRKLSGPLLDRFDIFLEIEKIEMKKIFEANQENDLDKIRQKIKATQESQLERFSHTDGINKNSEMSIREIKKYCLLDSESQKFLNTAAKNLHLSNRAYLKTIKLARTIADLENSSGIVLPHLAEALQYRQNIVRN